MPWPIPGGGVGRVGFIKGREGRSVVPMEGWLWWSVHTLGGCVCKDHTQNPGFALGTSEMAVDLWPFCILLLIFAPFLHLCN